ncbi:MAG: hypothetical protein NZ480_04480 [Bdellovibrionaceae bacterium]|nr:hypothetical protein [Pseudobdellovibrionaceae bacterium]MDW8189804.1 hypothetical protein [Pseudobdellovibrionaceae bacterium]
MGITRLFSILFALLLLCDLALASVGGTKRFSLKKYSVQPVAFPVINFPSSIPSFQFPEVGVLTDFSVNYQLDPLSSFSIGAHNLSFTLNYNPNLLPREKLIPLNKKEVPLHNMSPFEYKMIQGEIFYRTQKLELALGVYLDVLPTVFGPQRAMVLDRLTDLAIQLDLYFDFKKWSLELFESPEMREKAWYKMVKNVKGYDLDFVRELMSYQEKYNISSAKMGAVDVYYLLAAHILLKENDLKGALGAVEKIPEGLSSFPKAFLLRSVIVYKLGDIDRALNQLEEAYQKNLFTTWPFEMRNEAYLLLARLYFQKANYEKSRNFYSKMDQNYIEWLPAQVESAWSQILMGDYAGASGNMFSLHTDYFKHNFIPESYVARTVGYLGLCQYGDALKSTIDLQQTYRPLIEKTAQIKEQWTESQYYQLIHEAISNPKAPEVMGIPRAWISFLTRDPSFIQEQKIINELENELNHYNTYALRIVRVEKSLLDLKKEILKKKELSEADRDDLEWVNTKLYILRKSREEIKTLRQAGIQRINFLKDRHKNLAGLALKKRMIETHKMLLDTFDKIEVLQYEIYSQAGDQLRHLLAGASEGNKGESKEESVSRDPASVRWKFKGEIWKDEIGHYRSSLTNLCPTPSGEEP